MKVPPAESPLHPLCMTNVPALWGGVLAEVLGRAGVCRAVISPGSRSGPLATGLALNPRLEAHVVLDERSAAFFALGLAKRTRKPVVLVCTSGSAAAHYLPALVEARLASVPLLVLTADRPPMLRDCHAGQTMDQVKLYGSHVVWQGELPLPQASLAALRHLRQTLLHALVRTQWPQAGPVHLNVPLDEPLAPVPDTQELPQGKDLLALLEAVSVPVPPRVSLEDGPAALETLRLCERGLIVVGHPLVPDPETWSQAVDTLARFLGWPVVDGGLSPLRHRDKRSTHLVSHHEWLLRQPKLAEALRPEAVLQLGPLPAAKQLRAWLQDTAAPVWTLQEGVDNPDPLHRDATHWHLSVEGLGLASDAQEKPETPWLSRWRSAERHACEALERACTTLPLPDDVAALRATVATLGADTELFFASSLAVRHNEWFLHGAGRRHLCWANRGVNGIDGTLSTALGLAQATAHPVCLFLGDLAFLHDATGLALARTLRGALLVVVLDNGGGGIFEHLPVAGSHPAFETLFATPQAVCLKSLCQAYAIPYACVQGAEGLSEALAGLPRTGSRVLHVRCDRKADAHRLRQLFSTLSATLDHP